MSQQVDEFERARWTGTVDARLGDSERRLAAVEAGLGQIRDGLSALRVEVGQTATKVAVGAFVAALVGSGVVGVVVTFVGQ